MWLTHTNRQEFTKVPPDEISSDYRQDSTYGSPLIRFKHAICAASNGFIYIHGGKSENHAVEDDVWSFDLKESRWNQLKTSGMRPPNLQEHSLIEYDDKLYLFGGKVSAVSTESSFWQLDLKSKEWRLLNIDQHSNPIYHPSISNRRGHSALVYKDSMYIYGGYEDFRGSSSQLWEYQLLNERWELCDLRATSICKPEPRHNHSAIVYQESMFIYGGLSNLKPLADLWRWSWKENRWFKEKTKGCSPGHLHGHSAVQAFGSMFVFGGERNGRKTCSLWRLNLLNMRWNKIRIKGPCPSSTVWHRAVSSPLSILDETNYIIMGNQDSKKIDNHQDSSLTRKNIQEEPYIFSTNDSNLKSLEKVSTKELGLVTNKMVKSKQNSSSNDEEMLNFKPATTIENIHLQSPVNEHPNYEDSKTKLDETKVIKKSYTSAPLKCLQTIQCNNNIEQKLTYSSSYNAHIVRESELKVVQSLIDRADNQIKQLYKPYFNTKSSERKRYSLCEYPARQKLAKTVTNYSLFKIENQNIFLNLGSEKFNTFRDICNQAILIEEHDKMTTNLTITSEAQRSSEKFEALDSDPETLCDNQVELDENSPSNSSICSITLTNSEQINNSFENALTVEDEQPNESFDITSLSFSDLVEYENNNNDTNLQYLKAANGDVRSSSSSHTKQQPLEDNKVSSYSENLKPSNKITDDSLNDTYEFQDEVLEIKLKQQLVPQYESATSGYQSNFEQENNMEQFKELDNSHTSCNFNSTIFTDSSHRSLFEISKLNKEDTNLHFATNGSSSGLISGHELSTMSFSPRSDVNQSTSSAKQRLVRLFKGNRRKINKIRYGQLCMIVFGGKQEMISRLHNEPITVWSFYI